MLARLTLASLFVGATLAGCPTCDTTRCYTTFEVAQYCLESIPFDNLWRSSTVETLTAGVSNYGLLDVAGDSGPPYFSKSRVLDDLASTLTKTYSSDWEFQEDVQAALASLHDAHMRYNKPACYDAISVMPFAFNASLETHPNSLQQTMAFKFVPSVYTDAYASVFPTVDFSRYFNKYVVSVNGFETLTAISNWAQEFETRSNDPSGLFNAAIRSFLYRSTRGTAFPKNESLHLVFNDGTSAEFPWLVSYSSAFGNINQCLANPTFLKESPEELPHPQRIISPEFEAPMLHGETLHKLGAAPRTIIIAPGASQSTVFNCFIQERVLVIKISSFSPPQVIATRAMQLFINDAITCMSAPDYDAIALDLMQNGGGYVCLGLKLLTMVFPEFNINPDKVLMTYDIPHSAFMDEYIQKTNSASPAGLNPETGLPFVDGNSWYYPGVNRTLGGKTTTYTNPFYMDCRSVFAMSPEFKPPFVLTQAPQKERVTIITDATCGSTCACFTKVASEAEQAHHIGVGGAWHTSMDISSFAGGFVSNPASFASMAKQFGGTFPQFVTSVSWQFDWAVWYSAVQVDRPAQFIQNAPDSRMPFWNFPHVSVSSVDTTQGVSDLYDQVVSDVLQRLEK